MDVQDVDGLLERHRDKFRRLLRSIAAEEEGIDPFSVSLSRFRETTPDERASLVRRAASIRAERIEREMRDRGAAWIVMVGDDVVAASSSAHDVPLPDTVLSMGAARDRVAYLFEASLIEELPHTSKWSPLDDRDRYPTIPLVLHRDPQSALRIVADLDTGSHASLFDAADFDAAAPTWFSGRHLGEAFLWTIAAADIEVTPSGGEPVRRRFAIRLVRDWQSSPFVRIHAGRRALAGRDLLRAFSLELALRASVAETEVRSAGA